MEHRLCKKCKRPLPDNYKNKYCENCQNMRAEQIRKMSSRLVKCGLTALTFIGLAAKGLLKKNDRM